MILLCFLISGIETRHNQIKDGFRLFMVFGVEGSCMEE